MKEDQTHVLHTPHSGRNIHEVQKAKDGTYDVSRPEEKLLVSYFTLVGY
jgi:hypothetical protein